MQTIHLDVSNKGVVPAIYAKQGDVGRKFRAVITDNGEAYDIPADVLLSVWYSGTSGEGNYSTIGENSAFSIDGNTVTVELITQMLTNHGGGNVCLVMNRQDGTQIGTWNIPYIVEQLPGMGSSSAEQYFTALSEVAGKAAESAAKAAEAAATFDTDQTLSVAGKAADAAATGEALSGKAPAGYGLGGEAEQKDWSEVDSVTANGTYRFGGIHQTINGIYVTSATMLVINFGGSYCTQILRTVENASGDNKSYTLIRSRGAIGWDVWKCPDPPMEAGVEYRTTKRWRDNVVYAKLVEVGSLLNNGTKRVTHDSGGSYYTYALGVAIAGTTTLLFTYEGARGKAYVEGSDVVFECVGDLSAYHGYILIEYVK